MCEIIKEFLKFSAGAQLHYTLPEILHWPPGILNDTQEPPPLVTSPFLYLMRWPVWVPWRSLADAIALSALCMLFWMLLFTTLLCVLS